MYATRSAKSLIYFEKGSSKKSYERRDYDSVDEESQS